MACETSPICNFLFGSLRMTLPTDMVDVDLTIQMVKGIYMYRRDHTLESAIFTPWSKKVTPFPSLRCKIQAYKDKQREVKVLHGLTPFSSQIIPLPRLQTNQRKRASAKIRGRWSIKARYNLTKTKRPNTFNLPITNMDMMDSNKAMVPFSVKVCNRFGLMFVLHENGCHFN